MAIKWLAVDAITDRTVQAFARLFAGRTSEEMIANVRTEVRILSVNEHLALPVTINDEPEENAFVCSPFTAYALYSRDELTHKVRNRWLQLPLQALIRLIGLWLKAGSIDKNVHVNNFLLSTNPYPAWSGDEIGEITRFLIAAFPKHAILFRSLNRYQHTSLIQQFERNGYLKLGSRQVYLYDTDFDSWKKRQNNQHDRRIINKQQLTYLSHEEMGQYLAEALALYNQLYLVKYSRYNPQFTLAFFQRCHEQHLMHFQGYRDASGRLRAFAGLFVWGDTITSPLVGYDTEAPKKEGLYIHAISLVMKYKFKHDLLLNLSSGAAEFKRLRGGMPSVEYSLVYTRHLSRWRRATWWAIISISNRIGVPLLEKYEL